MVDGGETTGGLVAESGGAPVFTAAFSRPASGPAVGPRAKIDPTNLLGAPGCSMRGPKRRKSPKSSSARGRGWMVGMALKGEIRAHPSRHPAWVARSVRSRRGG